MSETTRIRIKRGSGKPIDNTGQTVLARGEMAFDELNKKLYIGKGIDSSPSFNNQANETFSISRTKYIVKTIENVQENQEVILILSTDEEKIVEKITVLSEHGECKITLKYDNTNIIDNQQIIENSVQHFLNNTDESDILIIPENSKIYLIFQKIFPNTDYGYVNFTIQLSYR